MKRYCLPVRLGTIVGSLSVVLALTLAAPAADHRGSMTEEFHQTYPLTGEGRVELENINGDVRISTWDRNEVKVDAIKYADSKDRLDEARIEVNAGSDSISVRTKYPEHDHWGWNNNPATVEYTLTVPRKARLDEIKLINGALDVDGVAGEVRASCINGRLDAKNLAGETRLSTINGHLQVSFEQLPGKSVELNSVNGGLDLTIPSDSNARLEANTVSGGISNDLGVHVNNHHFVGHDLKAEIGKGGTRIELKNVNGHIGIHHANDGRSLSPVKDMNHPDKGDDKDDAEI